MVEESLTAMRVTREKSRTSAPTNQQCTFLQPII